MIIIIIIIIICILLATKSWELQYSCMFKTVGMQAGKNLCLETPVT